MLVAVETSKLKTGIRRSAVGNRVTTGPSALRAVFHRLALPSLHQWDIRAFYHELNMCIWRLFEAQYWTGSELRLWGRRVFKRRLKSRLGVGRCMVGWEVGDAVQI